MAAAVQFNVIDATDHNTFVKGVERYLNEGYQLHGDLKVLTHQISNGTIQTVRYIQAVVKKHTNGNSL